ncbi:formin-like protein 8 [Iris pallida]|uniref:Formin-like protein n=1 Tax=Iris pallida TaxID=29817 RepID=A0AAX6HR04_IRIPA|nr:formin-like protein 8 [Iris pallida]
MKVKDSMVADEDGLDDAVYWRKLGSSSSSPRRCHHCYNILHAAPSEEEASSYRNVVDDRKVQRRPLIPSGSLNSSAEITKVPNPVVPPPAPPPPPPPPPPKVAPTPPPPPPPRNLPPPPPPIAKKNPAPPGPPMPPMPPRPNAPRSSGVSTPPPGGGPSRPLPAVQGAKAKLRPLHWDKVTAVNPEHSMVWDKIDANGSFRFDDDLMESLFGYAAGNRQTNKSSTNPFLGPSTPRPSQVCLLDPRKSQNSAIVIRSLAVGRQEILDALLEGRGLGHDVLEKLSKIAPTGDEESRIVGFAGDPSTLADAESFLYHLLRAVPSPFARLRAMLFRSGYEAEILHLKQSLQTLELACRELKSRGLFLKLLEAILKAGNRMNAGTARGDARAFNLTALCKLSDVKSADGKTTLLHFVVEEVVRLEGKRLCVLNRSASLSRIGSSGALKASREQKEKEYMTLGLPVVGGLSSELANVKKAATVDFEALVSSCLSAGERVGEIREFLKGCAADGFVEEMKGFLEAASEEIRVVGEEQLRIMELVRRTTEYYQPGSSKDKGQQHLQLFVIVRDFLVMFDRVCVDITRSTQKKPAARTTATTTPNKAGSPKEEAEELRQRRVVATFPNLPPRFMTENLSSSSSSDSEEEF